MRLVRWALPLVLAGAATASSQPQVFSDKVTVREVGVVAELPQVGIGPRDLVVTEGGMSRAVTRTGEVDGPWTAVVYVDRELARAETAFLATLALAGRSDRLAGLGGVEVVVAEPSPRMVLAGTREARRLRETLSEVAGKARVERDRGAERPAAPDATILRRQVDRLVTALAGYSGPGPRVLFLVADGFDVEISEARLRRMLAGSSLPATLPLKVEVEPSGPARWRVKLRVDPFVGPAPLVPAPVRLSFAPAGAEDPLEIRHQPAPGIENPDQGWTHTAEITVPQGARRLAVGIEDLARERWSGAVVDLAPVRPRR